MEAHVCVIGVGRCARVVLVCLGALLERVGTGDLLPAYRPSGINMPRDAVPVARVHIEPTTTLCESFQVCGNVSMTASEKLAFTRNMQRLRLPDRVLQSLAPMWIGN